MSHIFFMSVRHCKTVNVLKLLCFHNCLRCMNGDYLGRLGATVDLLVTSPAVSEWALEMGKTSCIQHVASLLHLIFGGPMW